MGENAELSVGLPFYNIPFLEESITVNGASPNMLSMLSHAPETVAITYSELGVTMSPLAIAVLTGISVFSGKNIYSPVDIPMQLSYHHAKLFPHRGGASVELASFRETVARFLHGQEDFQSQRDSGDLRRIQNVEEYNRLQTLDDGLTKNSKVSCRVPTKSEKADIIKQVKSILPEYKQPTELPKPVLSRDCLVGIPNQDNLAEYEDLLFPSAGAFVELPVPDIDDLL